MKWSQSQIFGQIMSDLGAQEHMEGVRCPEVSTNGQLHTREASGAGLETTSFGVPALVLKLLVLFDLLTGCFMPSNRCRSKVGRDGKS